MNFSGLPEQWIETLRDIQFIFPTAVIAGGCLRDTFFEKEVKDVDIFIQEDDLDYYKVTRLLPMALSVELKCLSNTTATDEYEQFAEETDRNLLDIYSFMRHGIEHQLIFLKPDDKMVHKFDLSFCQATYDGKHLTSTLAFEETLKTKVVTLGEGRPINACIKRRIERFKIKYPELTFPETPNTESPYDL